MGNDLTRMLNFDSSIDISDLDVFFNKLNSPQTKEYKLDTWKICFNSEKIKEDALMLSYFGLGCDAHVAQTVEIWRRKFPFLFKINRITKFFYSLSWVYNFFKSLCFGKVHFRLTDIKLEIDG